MVYNFLHGHRDQQFLLPLDVHDRLRNSHLAWLVLDVVHQLDLDPFYRQHRDDGHGHPAYNPKLLLGILLYGHCIGVRCPGSSSGAAPRTSPSESLPPTRPPTT